MVTIDQIKKIFPRASAETVTSFSQQAPEILQRYGISYTQNRLHYFLAQIGHESGGLTVMEERLNYSAQRLVAVFPNRFPTLASAADCAGNPQAFACQVYGNRMGNGPPESGDGYRYRGRGYIQITGKNNYRAVGCVIGLNLLADPDRACSAADALEVACGYWKLRDLNTACDAGDFSRLTKLINGGTVGLEDRRAWLNKVRQALAEPPSKQPSPAVVIAVQRALRARGFIEIGAADGIIGPRTAAAIRLLRHRNGLPDGLIDEPLLDLLEVG